MKLVHSHSPNQGFLTLNLMFSFTIAASWGEKHPMPLLNQGGKEGAENNIIYFFN